MKKYLLAALFFIITATAYSDASNDVRAYIVYKEANDSYKLKNFEDARNGYLKLINEYPLSKFVPYSVYMLSFIETDYIKIIDYLCIIKEKYPDFQYWTNAIEKLADIFYIMDDQKAAIAEYCRISTDRSYYMLSLINSSNGLRDKAEEYAFKLLKNTKDSSLAYKGFIILIKSYLDKGKLSEAAGLTEQALKLKKWAFDNGARALYYAGKCYFYRRDIENHLEKSFYIFSLLKTTFPLSPEASMSNEYFDYFNKNNINKADEVRWIADAFTTPVDLPYQKNTLTVLDKLEKRAENISGESEGVNGKYIKSDFQEYVVRIGEFKDLSVANLAVADIVKSGRNIPLGVFYRNDMYIAEIRGIKVLEDARELAQELISMGYSDTKVIEVVKVIQFSK